MPRLTTAELQKLIDLVADLKSRLTATEQDLAGARYELNLTRQENADLKARIERAKEAAQQERPETDLHRDKPTSSIADMVRMLGRYDFDHEIIVTATRDRLRHLNTVVSDVLAILVRP